MEAKAITKYVRISPTKVRPVMDLVRGARSKLNPATLAVRSVPSGARVRLDGETVGPTDLELPIRAGVHVLELALKGYQSVSQEIAVGDGQRRKLEVRLVPSEGMRRPGDHDVGTGVVPIRRPKLQKLRPGARVIAHDFDIDEWKPTRIEYVKPPKDSQDYAESRTLYIWVVGNNMP